MSDVFCVRVNDVFGVSVSAKWTIRDTGILLTYFIVIRTGRKITQKATKNSYCCL